jgi:hypothetical protein
MEQHKYTDRSDFAKKYGAQGLKQGLEQGYRALLGALLEQRFGKLPVEVLARLDAADDDALSAWGRRVLTAASLADVFAPEPA